MYSISNIIRHILLNILFANMFIPIASSDEIMFRIVDENRSSNFTTYQNISCFNDKNNVFINLPQKPFIINKEQILQMRINRRICIDDPYVNLVVKIKNSISDMLKDYSKKIEGTQIAIFFNNDLIGTFHVYSRIDDGFSINSCLPLDKAVAIMMNFSFTPNFQEICIGGKLEPISLESKYKFKKQNKSKLTDSEFWVLTQDTKMYKSPNGDFITMVNNNKVVEQFYNENLGRFESNDDWLRIIYNGEIGWIKKIYAIPFFTIFDNDIFFQKLFVFNEHRYLKQQKHKSSFSNYIVGRLVNIRGFYIKEALSRFHNVKDFERWYFETFAISFKK